jgi:hypothetical protein
MKRHLACIFALVISGACASPAGDLDDPSTNDAGTTADTGTTLPPFSGPDELDTVTGCQGVYNPDQVLTYHLTLSTADWEALLADTTYSVYFPASFRCDDGPEITVGLRHKRSGGAPKVGLKVDFDRFVLGQTFHGLKKLSLENGISQGGTTGSVADVVSEYLAWRFMVRSGSISSRAALAIVEVNGERLGAYTNVEQINKRFLRTRLGHNDGWLYKKSGGTGDGYKTNEGQPNPYADYFCFWERMGCAPPADLETSLPVKLNIQQMLFVGAMNAIIANTDSPIRKDNNYLFYDYEGGRHYFAWDLDTVMQATTGIFASVPGGTTMWSDVLFAHWEDDYRQLLQDLLTGPLALEVIEAELDRALEVGGPALDADPYLSGSAAETIESLRSYWSTRHPQLRAEVGAL